jgi:uncharacterized protein (TIGR02646 family)
MIQQDKSRVPLPKSLQAGTDSQTDIEKKRSELIDLGKYPSSKDGAGKYNSAYKKPDIKEALQDIYFEKCCYCDTRIRRADVEHYRPKSKYWWLAYSWDNLLLACPTCNQDHKSARFDINGEKGQFTPDDLDDIHNLALSPKYQNEGPQLLHPEIDDPELHLKYDKLGNIDGVSDRGSNTIDTCGLNVPKLVEWRKEIIDTFEKHLDSELFEHKQDPIALRLAIRTLVNSFSRNAQNPKNELLGFRRFVIKNGILAQMIKEKTSH